MTVPQGAVYGFLGPNGAGKTTTLRLLVGLLRPDAGSIVLLGRPYTWQDRTRLFKVGSLIEQPSFYPYLSGRDNLRVIGATGGGTTRQRIDQVLDLVGLTPRANSKLKTYSLGMKQRLGIAASLLSDPDLLLLDEPANGLDPAGIVAMRETLRAITAAGKTVLVSSHILPEVQQLADVVGIVDRGRLIREGPLDALLAESSHVRVAVAPAQVAQALAIILALPAQADAAPLDGPHAGWIAVRLPASYSTDVNRVLAQNGIFASALETRSDLEEVFLALTSTVPAGRQVGPTGWGTPGVV